MEKVQCTQCKAHFYVWKNRDFPYLAAYSKWDHLCKNVHLIKNNLIDAL